MSGESVSINSQLREAAVSEVLKESPQLNTNPIEFIKKVAEKFMELQLHSFPKYCEIARWQNKIKYDELRDHGIKGKYTDSIGWSPEREFKFDFEIPEDLYLFMVNMVYRDFWANDNEKVWRAFMNAICRGDDPMECLMKVKVIYGSNSQKISVV